MAMIHIPLAVRFWRHVAKDLSGCWHWTGAKNDRGYGNTTDDTNRPRLVHRLSYEMHRGAIPPGLIVRHSCDARHCVNPDHLVLGTHRDNTRDMYARQRQHTPGAPGERNYNAKLTATSVRDIRQQVASGARQRDVATAFGVCQAQVSSIVRRHSWASLS